jgi:hypothetical protein
VASTSCIVVLGPVVPFLHGVLYVGEVDGAWVSLLLLSVGCVRGGFFQSFL